MEHQWLTKAPFYVRKPHKCPSCGRQLGVDKRKKAVRIGSAEYKELRLRANSSSFSSDGKIMVHWKEFWCGACQRHYTIEEVKRHEGIPL